MLPYLRRRLEHRLENYRDEIERHDAENVVAKRRAIQLYGWITAAYDAAQVLQYIAYMANVTRSHSLLLRALRMNLVYLPSDDDDDEWTLSDLFQGRIKWVIHLSRFYSNVFMFFSHR